ncbi:hypothetical protein LX32DRAFT_640253, partial [Colletotrichum zoysiae]
MPALEPQLLHTRSPSKTKLAIVAGSVGKGSPFFCVATEAAAKQNAIPWMDFYARSASSFLRQRDAGQTATFVAWFGC